MSKHDRSNQIEPRRISPIPLVIPGRALGILLIGIALGGLVAGIGYAISADGLKRLQLAYLVAFVFVLSLSLGSLFFVILQHLTRAGWSVVVRRPAEIYAMNTLTVLLIFLPLAYCVWNGEIYPWAGQAPSNDHDSIGHVREERAGPTEVHTNVVAKNSAAVRPDHSQEVHGNANDHNSDLYVHQRIDELTRSKAPWLNRQAFLLRTGVYFAIWLTIAGCYFTWSRRQDLASGSLRATQRMEWCAGISAIAFGLSLTFAAFDLVMSLDPHWYSTLFGVYFFAGCAVGGVAWNLLTQQLLCQWQPMPRLLNEEHRRDLGRFLFAFVFFWGYIAFSQYMLLWYANVPETTRWFAVRGASQATGLGNSWGYLLVALLFGHFLIPFLGIISRHMKTNLNAMYFWTIWLLAFHYLDLYWLIMPELGPKFRFGLIEIGTLMCVMGIYLAGAYFIARRTSIIALGDPRLSESANLVEVY